MLQLIQILVPALIALGTAFILWRTLTITNKGLKLPEDNNEIARHNLEISKQAFEIQTLYDLLNEYSSTEMQDLVDHMWDFYGKTL